MILHLYIGECLLKKNRYKINLEIKNIFIDTVCYS